MINIHVNKVVAETPEHECLIEYYSNLFKGIANLKGVNVKLHIDKDGTPVTQQARWIPKDLRKQVEKELHHLKIEDVQGPTPTPWVSPLVIIPRKMEMSDSTDMQMANCATKRERHPTPTTDDLIHTQHGHSVFKIDLCSEYHQLSLVPKSCYITSFAKHKGLK